MITKSLMKTISMALLMAVVLPTISPAQEQEQWTNADEVINRRITAPPSLDRPYDVLHIKDGGSRVVNPETGNTVFKQGPDRRFHWELIELALYHAHVTVIPSGTVKLEKRIEIPTSYTTLIIGPDATLTGEGADRVKGGVGDVIKNIRRDHVNIFNLGTIDTGGEFGTAVTFDGRSGGKLGIRGGLLFQVGTIKGTHTGHWLVDSSNVHVPVMWSRDWGGSSVLVHEGNEDLDVGFIAGLKIGKAQGEGEVQDVQPRNKRTRIEHLVGTLLEGQDEILDINNSPNTWVGKAVAYGNIGADKEEIIGGSGSQFIDKHKYGARKNRRQTQKVWIDRNSPGTEIEKTRLVNKDIKAWKTYVKTPGFPEQLPMLQVNVRLKAVFEDGSSEWVFAKNYGFDLINRSNRGSTRFPGGN